MRTTLTIDDDIADFLKEQSRTLDLSFKQVVNRLLRQGMANVRGPDAALVLDHLTTRDISRIAPGQAAYLSVLTDQGTMADDAIVSNNGEEEWMIVHGSGDTMALLEASAAGKNA
ncbi:MAG: hypothetical protein AAF236_15095, partial [Verrucomicrobiota bacterium]